MSRKPDDESWAESPFNDPRQIAMDFAVHPEDDFETFHLKNPRIWREFRTMILERYNHGERTLDPGAILKDITGGVTLRQEIVTRYWTLFTSNHQEMEHAFTIAPAEHSST